MGDWGGAAARRAWSRGVGADVPWRGRGGICEFCRQLPVDAKKGPNLDYSSAWMKVLLFAAGQHDAEIIIKNSVFIHVDPRHDDSNPSALFCGVRSMSIQLHPARLASGSDLSRELSRLNGQKWRKTGSK
jgi:hypothetical protein